MATLSELQTLLTNIETAISAAVTRGMSRVTVGSVDKTYYSLAELRRWRNEIAAEISGKTHQGGTNYARF